jgi:hypothetical protein
MSVMASSTVKRPSLLQARTCARILQDVAADGRRNAEADEPPPVTDARWLGDASIPAEAGGAFAQAFGEMARGKRQLALGLDLSVVAQAQLDWTERQGLGQLVHRTFERQQPDCVARCAH